MKKESILVCLIGIMAICGCSVKEDRMPCPLWLSCDMGMFQPHSMTAWAVISHGGGTVSDEVVFKNGRTVFDWAVSKGEINVSAWCGIEGRHLQGHRIIVPAGERVPAFYGASYLMNCHEESVCIFPEDNRQSARLTIRAVMPDGEAYPYDILVEGNICGMDLLSLEPVEGKFGHPVELDEDNKATFQLLRQSEDGMLTLHLLDNAKVIESLPLGEMILRTGYDWEASDLADLSIRLEQGILGITVIVSDWEHNDGESEYEFVF